MTHTEALKMALDALIELEYARTDKSEAMATAAIASISAALDTAQPAPAPEVAGDPVAEVGDLILSVRERVVAAGIKNRAPLYATAQPAPAAVPADMREAVQRLVIGFEHVSGIARQWEPDHSSGADRAKWARATEACADVVRLLAAAPQQAPTGGAE